MPALGNFLLLASFVACAYVIAVSVAGARRRSSRLIDSGVGAFYLVTALMTVASGVMVHAFLTGNYSIKYVSRYSDAALPLPYKIASYWGGLDGSIMFWVFLLSVFGAIAVYTNRERHRELMPWVVSVIAATEMFFLLLMVVHNNPFSTYVTSPPADGQGLNPLLQNFYMAIHPPSLYVGLVAMTIPFAFGIAALITGHLDDAWLRAGRLARVVVRADAGHVVGVRGARVGWLLDVGSGRERRTAAVVHGDGVPAFGDGPGTPRDAARVERDAGHHDVLPHHLRHLHDPVGDRSVRPRVR
jgi:cytochrome c biogenesis factor